MFGRILNICFFKSFVMTPQEWLDSKERDTLQGIAAYESIPKHNRNLARIFRKKPDGEYTKEKLPYEMKKLLGIQEEKKNKPKPKAKPKKSSPKSKKNQPTPPLSDPTKGTDDPTPPSQPTTTNDQPTTPPPSSTEKTSPSNGPGSATASTDSTQPTTKEDGK